MSGHWAHIQPILQDSDSFERIDDKVGISIQEPQRHASWGQTPSQCAISKRNCSKRARRTSLAALMARSILKLNLAEANDLPQAATQIPFRDLFQSHIYTIFQTVLLIILTSLALLCLANSQANTTGNNLDKLQDEVVQGQFCTSTTPLCSTPHC